VRRTVGIAAALAISAIGAIAHSQIINNGNCVVIIQGNWNTANQVCSEPLPVYPAEPEYNHVWDTPSLGMRFEQDGKWLPIFTTQDRKKLIVDFAPRPFVIWLPDDHWSDPNSDLPALQVSISWDKSTIEQPSERLFQEGTGMADTMRGSGQLILVDPNDDMPPHNYIIGRRFNRKMPNWRGIFVSVIDTAPAAGNMITADTQGYAVFLMQEDDTPKLPGVPLRNVPLQQAPRDNVELNFASAR
jgi:hypothetical protein